MEAGWYMIMASAVKIIRATVIISLSCSIRYISNISGKDGASGDGVHSVK